MRSLIVLMGLLFIGACAKIDRIGPSGFVTDINADSIVFAEVGDFGSAGLPEYEVAKMIKSWNPDFIISAGDNNYEDGKLQTIQNNITQFYGDFIYNYDAPKEYRCNGKAFEDRINRFFPCPGNHDSYNRNDLTPYFNFFTLPGNESYYTFRWGPVTFYSLNTVDENMEAQKDWLVSESKKANTLFKIVFFHHPPFSTAFHGDNSFMQWPFHEYGIDVVFTGHDHVYNRIEKLDQKGVVYIVNGLGGRGLFPCNSHPLNENLFHVFCFSENYGAIKVTATANKMVMQFFSIDSEDTVDTYTIEK